MAGKGSHENDNNDQNWDIDNNSKTQFQKAQKFELRKQTLVKLVLLKNFSSNYIFQLLLFILFNHILHEIIQYIIKYHVWKAIVITNGLGKGSSLKKSYGKSSKIPSFEAKIQKFFDLKWRNLTWKLISWSAEVYDVNQLIFQLSHNIRKMRQR